MTDVSVHIGRLRLRLRGVDAGTARASVDGIGPALLERLAAQIRAAEPGMRAHPGVDLGRVAAASPDSTAVRATVADAVADAVAARLPQRHGGQL